MRGLATVEILVCIVLVLVFFVVTYYGTDKLTGAAEKITGKGGGEAACQAAIQEVVSVSSFLGSGYSKPEDLFNSYKDACSVPVAGPLELCKSDLKTFLNGKIAYVCTVGRKIRDAAARFDENMAVSLDYATFEGVKIKSGCKDGGTVLTAAELDHEIPCDLSSNDLIVANNLQPRNIDIAYVNNIIIEGWTNSVYIFVRS